MYTRIELFRRTLGAAALAAALAAGGAGAQERTPASWQVSKSSGEVWVTSASVQPAALTRDSVLNPGDAIRTGRTGRVLITRGSETILVSPNTVVEIPATQENSGTTTIIQRAGAIMLDVEKRNVKHFEVETPYLVAVVKGTQFTVSVGQNDARVRVAAGEVEVADFKSGQVASVLPGQTAVATSRGAGGLSVSGSGVIGPVRQGAPRSPGVSRVPVPRNGLTAPRASGQQNVHRIVAPGDARPVAAARAHGLRIGAPLGEVKVDVHKVSNGFAREAKAAPTGRGGQTVWKSGDVLPGNGVGKSYNAGNNGSGNGAGGAAGGGSGNAGGNGNGNANGAANSNAGGNGNGNAYGLAGGNGNAFGLNGGNGRGRGRGGS